MFNCGNCRFFDDLSQFTHCRRRPPTPMNLNGSSVYPLVPWFAAKCGEYRVHPLRFLKNLGRKMDLPVDVPSKEG